MSTTPFIRVTVVEPDPILDIDRLSLTMPTTYSFNSTNDNWTKNNEHNQFFLSHILNFMQDHLNALGYLFLNDILRQVGIDPIPAGQLIGWVSGEQINGNWTYLDGEEYVLRFPTAHYILDKM